MPNSHVATAYVAEVSHRGVSSVLRILNFTPFHSMTSHFQTSALNDTQMTWNTTRQEVHLICVTNTPKLQISVRFALCYQYPRVPNFSPFHSTISRVTKHLEASVLNDPKMILNITRSKVHLICVTSVPKPQISVSLLYDQPFSRYHALCNSLLTNMLNGPKIAKFHISLNNFGRNPSQEYR